MNEKDKRIQNSDKQPRKGWNGMRHDIYDDQKFGWDPSWESPTVVSHELLIPAHVSGALADRARSKGISTGELAGELIRQRMSQLQDQPEEVRTRAISDIGERSEEHTSELQSR